MSLFAIFGLGVTEMAVLGVIGVLLFGKRLPEVGKYLGQSIVQFKKGMKGLEDEIDPGTAYGSPSAAAPQPVDQIRAPQRVAATAPKFEETPANPPQV